MLGGGSNNAAMPSNGLAGIDLGGTTQPAPVVQNNDMGGFGFGNEPAAA